MGGVNAARSTVHDRFIGSFAAGSQVVDRRGASETWVKEHQEELRQQHDPQAKGDFVVRSNGNDLQLWWTPGPDEYQRLDVQRAENEARYAAMIAEQQRLSQERALEQARMAKIDAEVRAQELERQRIMMVRRNRKLDLRYDRPPTWRILLTAWLAKATPFQAYRSMRKRNGTS